MIPYKNILIILPARLGDAIFLTPIFRLIYQYCSGLTISVYASSMCSLELVQHNPCIHHLFSMNDFNHLGLDYDLVIPLYDNKQIQLLLKKMCGSIKIYDPFVYEEIPQTEKYLIFFSKILNISTDAFDRYYDLFPQIQDKNKIKQILDAYNLNADKNILIGFHLGCHGLSKRRKRLWNRFLHSKAWPFKCFIQLARRLIQKNPRIRIVLTGTTELESEMGKIFCKKVPSTINLVGQTSVLELAALISYLKCLVANDTGTLHVACAYDIPIVALFGGTNSINNGPYPLKRDRIVLQKCKIERITVDEVFRSVCYLLNL